ncbi:MAG: RsmD family RNA methyltransferase [Spirochaetaceae bacterium]|jgi:16S rRNA (guanine(966)-N(2))-methyltransferase RsmD|nr:RsmD family RNA methyltransferase [Spirochaetaceae bacterium]
MRITGGVLRGRQVAIPEGQIRPAMDRMRESVFAILGDLSGASFLDIFSGSGIIALEAASRGANPVEAVEIDTGKRKILLANAAISPVPLRCHFMAAELFIRRSKTRFDYIFCDPPFPYKFRGKLVQSIALSPLMGPDSRLLLHRPREDPPAALPENLFLADTRQYGRSVVDIFMLK